MHSGVGAEDLAGGRGALLARAARLRLCHQRCAGDHCAPLREAASSSEPEAEEVSEKYDDGTRRERRIEWHVVLSHHRKTPQLSRCAGRQGAASSAAFSGVALSWAGAPPLDRALLLLQLRQHRRGLGRRSKLSAEGN
jgi:hypothetical protein